MTARRAGVFASFSTLAALGGLAACVSATPGELPSVRARSDARDTASVDAARTDAAASPCDPSAPFGAPQVVPVPAVDGGARSGSVNGGVLSEDELTVYVYLDGTTDHIFRARRDTPTSAFGELALVPVVNDFSTATTADRSPFVTADGLDLYFSSDRLGNGAFKLYVAKRRDLDADFGAPSLLSSAVNDVGAVVERPWVTPAEVWYDRDGDIWVADRTATGPTNAPVWTEVNPRPVNELNSPATEGQVIVTRDGLRVFFESSRSDGGAKGGVDVWTAKRADVGQPFTDLANVAEVNAKANDTPTWISADGCRLYLNSDRDGFRQLYVASRPSE
jgi:hypothetical protein